MLIIMGSALVSLTFADFGHVQTKFDECTNEIDAFNDENNPAVIKLTTMESIRNNECFIRSTCQGQGQVVDHKKAHNRSACLNQCKSNSECEWATFDLVFHFCTHFSTCPSIDFSRCQSCITSSKDCPLELPHENPCNVNGKCQVIDLKAYISKNFLTIPYGLGRNY